MIRTERIVANWLIKTRSLDRTGGKNIQIVVVGYLSRSHQHSPALDQQLLVLIRKGPPCRSQGKCHHPCPPEELALLGGGVIQKEREMNLVSFCPQSNGARIIKDSCLCNLLIPRSFSFGENCQLLAPLSRLYSFMWAVCVGTDFFNCGLHMFLRKQQLDH